MGSIACAAIAARGCVSCAQAEMDDPLFCLDANLRCLSVTIDAGAHFTTVARIARGVALKSALGRQQLRLLSARAAEKKGDKRTTHASALDAHWFFGSL